MRRQRSSAKSRRTDEEAANAHISSATGRDIDQRA
jgi:hypothetical protein